VDPIEKKPFFHFHPTTTAFSIATAGCNVNCKFCQNWEISQSRPEDLRAYDLPPESLVELCERSGAPTIAYTYSEPVVFAEYVVDVAKEARRRGIRNVLVSNGYIQKEPLEDMLKVLDAVKIDLKSFREKYYREVCEGELAPVLETLERIAASGVWLEIVYLVVPTLNDSSEEFGDLARWCVERLGPDVPMHFSRFFPQYRLKNLPPTPIATLERARDIYREAGGRFVYIGNVPGHEAENTTCPSCGELLVRRNLYDVRIESLEGGRCGRCGEKIPGIWGEEKNERKKI
jgi:pyruvate formate lyase activating enzyme